MNYDSISNKKKRLKIYYALLIVILSIIGISFAWFRLFLNQSKSNEIATRSCFSATLTEETSKIELADAFPISDEEGLKQAPFTFTIKNNCDEYVKASITLVSEYRQMTSSSYLKDDYVKVNLSPNDTVNFSSGLLSSYSLGNVEENKQGYIILTTYFSSKEEKSYDLRIWLDSNTTLEQGLNKIWKGKIVIITEAIKELPAAPNNWYDAGTDTLLGTLRETVEVQDTLSIPGQEVSLDNEMVLASTDDDYGTSYYYRGAVENNYLVFANKCWRIVRITGSGAIKLTLYNNSSSSCTETGDTLGFLKLNNQSSPTTYTNGNSYNAADYSLMYGVKGGIKSPLAYLEQSYSLLANEKDSYIAAVGDNVLDSYEYSEIFVNKNKSVILSALETWYLENLTSFDDYLDDVVWCNDIRYDVTFNRFFGYNRLKNGMPSLVCQNDSLDRNIPKYTVNDTVYGNGDLTYKIGMLTADELMFAGAAESDNTDFYLYSNAIGEWWTLTPGYYSGSYYTGIYFNKVLTPLSLWSYGYYIRPSIALKASVAVTGTGTSEDPYVVKN